MRRWRRFVAVLALGFAACGKQPPADPVMFVAEGDPRMAAAIDKARATVNTFIAALSSPKPGQSDFSVKIAFIDGDNTEHMWLNPVTYDGMRFTGTVDNEPESVATVKLGQVVTVAPAEISDWMYLENHKLVGGQTLRAPRDTLTPAERADFDKSTPFVIV